MIMKNTFDVCIYGIAFDRVTIGYIYVSALGLVFDPVDIGIAIMPVTHTHTD